MSVSGMTDLQLVSEALRDEGFTPEEIRLRAPELAALYHEELERLTGGEELYDALPGAPPPLECHGRSHHPAPIKSGLRSRGMPQPPLSYSCGPPRRRPSAPPPWGPA